MTRRLARLGGALLVAAAVAGWIARGLSVPGVVALAAPLVLAAVGLALVAPFAWWMAVTPRGTGRAGALARGLGVGAVLVGATVLAASPLAATYSHAEPQPPVSSEAVTTAGADIPVPFAPPPPAGSAGCPATLQSLVDAAGEGATVRAPACLYRETVRIDRPMTLVGEPGAEIRGSDVWTEWTATADGWDSVQGTPDVEARGVCIPGTTRCQVAQQAFRDGAALRYEAGPRPAPDAFTVLPDNRIRLGADPAGSVVEVSVRELWVHVVAPDVTVEGFVMRDSMVPAQAGGITVGGYGSPSMDRATIRNNRLSDAHGALVSIQGGSGHVVEGNTIERGGQLGLHLAGEEGISRDWRIEGNLVRDNATDGFDVGWESGGLKSLFVTGIAIVGNEFAGSPVGDNGRGAWTDTGTRDVEFRDNVMHGNGYQGAMFESSHGLVVTGNVAWGNGWAPRAESWAWGGGIVLSSSDHAEVRDNLVAWNADGISVVSQERGDDEPHTAITLADNTVLAADRADDPDAHVIAWVMDWPGVLCDPGSGNEASGNRAWLPEPEAGAFSWCGTLDAGAFATVPGGAGTTLLSEAEAMAAADDAGVPWTPGPAGIVRTVAAAGVRIAALALGLAAGLALAGALLARPVPRRRAAGAAIALAGTLSLLVLGATVIATAAAGVAWLVATWWVGAPPPAAAPSPDAGQVPH